MRSRARRLRLVPGAVAVHRRAVSVVELDPGTIARQIPRASAARTSPRLRFHESASRSHRSVHSRAPAGSAAGSSRTRPVHRQPTCQRSRRGCHPVESRHPDEDDGAAPDAFRANRAPVACPMEDPSPPGQPHSLRRRARSPSLSGLVPRRSWTAKPAGRSHRCATSRARRRREICGSVLIRLMRAAPRGVAANRRSRTIRRGRRSRMAWSACIGSVSAKVRNSPSSPSWARRPHRPGIRLDAAITTAADISSV